MKKSLYQISVEALNLASTLEEGEFTPEIENQLNINQNELQSKGIDYAYAIKSIEDDVSIIEEEIKRLTAIKNAKKNAIDRMKDSVTNAMNIYGLKSIKSPTISLSVRRSEAVEIVNIDQLTGEYLSKKITISPDKVRIKDAIKSGYNVDGAVIVENFSLVIK